MIFNVSTVNKILGIDESYKAPERMLNLILDDEKRPEIFKKFLDVSTDMSFDWFHEYYQDEQAERKSQKQDFTPDSIAQLLNDLVEKDRSAGEYFEPAAGTGGVLIKRWWNDRLKDPVHLAHVKKSVLDKNKGISIFTYDPRNYWYQVEEMSDRALPFLIFNMSIRGMNGAIVQCDSLSRKTKEVYFIRNNTSDFLAFSDVIKMPHTKEIEEFYHISKWVKEFK